MVHTDTKDYFRQFMTAMMSLAYLLLINWRHGMEIEMTKEKSKAEPSALKGTSVLMMLTSLLALSFTCRHIFK